jgi:hypothetical protein
MGEVYSGFMRAAAVAKKKQVAEPAPEASAESRTKQLWINPSTLPTALAQRGKKQHLEPLVAWSSIKRKLPKSRVLEYADIALGRNRRRETDQMPEPQADVDDWESESRPRFR